MKKITLMALVAIFMSCSDSPKDSSTIDTHIVSDFFTNMESLQYVKDPINSFVNEANSIAVKSMSLTKDNIQDVLEEAKQFKKSVVVTGNHTIVMFDDLQECKKSGSWGACMPYARGYIKKGELIFQEDFINNIIGKPDSQERTVYFFN